MAQALKLLISCHCGASKQTVRLHHPSSAPQEISLCHCDACRHNTGLLCVSYASIEHPDLTEGLVEYSSEAETTTRLFCAICGCHIFQRLQSPVGDDANTGVTEDAVTTAVERERWAVATGVIIGESEESSKEDSGVFMEYAKHINTADTKDGGLSPFIRPTGGAQGVEVVDNWGPPRPAIKDAGKKPKGPSPDADPEVFIRGDNQERRAEEVLNAFCHCKTVQFHITRPDTASKLPRSNFPDLMVPYSTGSPQIQNPEDTKWWLRPSLNDHSEEFGAPSQTGMDDLKRYLAGTCACRSCRLTSGFEIQTWAFIPRANIFFHIRNDHTGLPKSEFEAPNIVPLDFATLPAHILTSYESSKGVRREFCSRCGATIFWRDRWRPELLDVSVGLLDAGEGARAESWLDWWTGRVSFAEDAGNSRTGETARGAKCLIDSLEEGLRKSGEREKIM
ncbi:hypothetical protein F5X98DRAFT_336318 [Xylaria grammica]|nr:hypothetical protein F5X98DRAFT_336318 [Xylaria grammica]